MSVILEQMTSRVGIVKFTFEPTGATQLSFVRRWDVRKSLLCILFFSTDVVKFSNLAQNLITRANIILSWNPMDARRRNKHATVAIPFALIQSGCSWKCILLICKVFLLAHLSVWRGLVYAWLLMAKLRYKTQTKSTLKGSLNLNRSSNSAIVALLIHLWDGKQIDYFEVACFAVHHCIALFCFKKHQKQHLKIIEQGVSHQKYVFLFTKDEMCKTGLFSIQRVHFYF